MNKLVVIALGAVACNVGIGFFVFPVAFFLSYAFNDHVSAADHGNFLVGVTMSLLIATSILTFFAGGVFRASPRQTFVGSFFASAAVTLVFFSLYFAFSPLPILQSSVTSGLSTLTYLLVAVACLAPGLVCVYLAVRTLPRNAD